MPLFTCQFRDPTGVLRETTVDAIDDLDAAQKLATLGIRGARVWRTDPVVAAAAVAPAPAAQAQRAPVAPPPVASANPYAQPWSPATPPPVQTVRTKKGTDSQRFTLFTQIGKQLNAGINPAQVLSNIGRVTRARHFEGSLREMSEAAQHGRPLSDVMDRYPMLYPRSTVGMARASEAGGFMPEAFELMGEQAREAHAFKRFHWFIWYLAPRAVIAIPLVLAIRQGLLESWKAATPTVNGTSLFLSKVWEAVLWPFGPLALLIIVVGLLLRWWLSSYPMTKFRHSLGLKFPVYGARARNESIAVFTWALSKMSKAGVPPQSAWQLAMNCVPNLEMRDRLADAGRMMHDGSKLSDAIFGSRLFPEEYAPIVQTGEIAGDMEGALNQLAAASRDEFSTSTNKAKFVSMRFGCIFMLLISGAVLIIMTWAWYREFYPTILRDFDNYDLPQ